MSAAYRLAALFLPLAALFAVPAMAQSGAEKTVLLSEKWQAGPAGIYHEVEARRAETVKLPKNCLEKKVYFAVQGLDADQKALCEFTVTYVSGGSSQEVKASVKGTQRVDGTVPSVVRDPGRRVFAECMADDRFREMFIEVVLTCESSLARDDEFQDDLDKFLSQ